MAHDSTQYPFGSAPRDPFDVATCPECRGSVGPGTPFCPGCFATHDDALARVHLIRPPAAQLARLMQVGLALVGLAWLLGLGVWLVGAGQAAPALSGQVATAATLVLVGAGGWRGFPRHAVVASVLAGMLFGLLAVVSVVAVL